jgi:hypothetical protein
LCPWLLLSEAAGRPGSPIPAPSGTAEDRPGDGRDPPGGGQLAQLYHFHPRTKRVLSSTRGTDVLALSHRPLPRIRGRWHSTGGPGKHCTRGRPNQNTAWSVLHRRTGRNVTAWHRSGPGSIRPGARDRPDQAARDRSDQGALKRRLEMVARDSPLWPALPGMPEKDHPVPSPAICRPDAQYRRWFRAAVDTKRSFRAVKASRGPGSGGLTTS